MIIKFIIIILTISNLWPVGEAGAIFLLIAPGAGAQGSGEAQVAKADDAYASYYNPAGLGFLKGSEAAGMHVNWLPNLASDLFYEFIAYRHYIEGLGSVGGHIIYLNLGEQIGMDEFGNPTDNWKSYMGAVAGSFGTLLSKNSSIGFNFKIFHQKLSDNVVAGEGGKGYSTDFGFDIGYLKKFKNTSNHKKKVKKSERLFDQLSEIYNKQVELNEMIFNILYEDRGLDNIIEEQAILYSNLEDVIEKYKDFNLLLSYSSLQTGLNSALVKMAELTNIMNEINNQDQLLVEDDEKFSKIESIKEEILLDIIEVQYSRSDINNEITKQVVQNPSDKFNFGFSISNIGPKIDFVDVDQADPAPTNMRLGIFAQLYNDGYNKINLLIDANKLLVTRYQMMDWDGDGYIGGFDEYGRGCIDDTPCLNDQLNIYKVADIRNSINALIQSQLETEMLANVRKDYLLRPLDSAYVPEKKSAPVRSMICIAGTFIGFMLSIFFILTNHYFFRKID